MARTSLPSDAVVTRFDRTTIKQIHAELEEAAKAIAARYGITAIQAGGRFGDNDFVAKIEFHVVPTDRQVNTPSGRPAPLGNSHLLDSVNCKFLGLPEDTVGRSFRHKTKTLTVDGIDMNKPKNPITLKDQNGKGFKCSVSMLKVMLNLI